MSEPSYNEILERVCDRLGWDPLNLQADDWQSIRRSVSEGMEELWDFTDWPSLRKTENRPMRTTYDKQVTYVAGSEVWFPPNETYYVVIRKAPTLTPPAAWDGKSWVTNLGYWAIAARSYLPGAFDPLKAYVVGDLAMDPLTALPYQCFAPVTGSAPPNPTYWGPLTEFVPTLAPSIDGATEIGEIEEMWDKDPRRFEDARPIEFTRTDKVWAVHQWPLKAPWIKYRIPRPRLVGSLFDPLKSYLPGDLAGTLDLGWGTSTLPILTAAGVGNLPNFQEVGALAGARAFVAGGYKFFAWQDELGSPAAAVGFRDLSTGLKVSMADENDGFNLTENGWNYYTVMIDELTFRVYRTRYALGGAITIVLA